MVENKLKYFRLEQRSVIQYSVAEACKACEIYLRMWDAYRGEYDDKKYQQTWVSYGFAITWVCHNKSETKRHSISFRLNMNQMFCNILVKWDSIRWHLMLILQ